MNKQSTSNIFKKSSRPLVFLSPLSFVILSACGGGSGTGKQSDFSGFVIKGPLQNAKVFADYNNDGILNDDEPTVLTNSDGSYLLSALDSFGAIVVQTDDSTIDTSSGEILSGVILKAPKGAQVVSPTSTMVVESNLTVSEIAEVLGLPSDFTLDFNPFDANADKDKAAVVEKTSQMLMSTINAVSASAEGIGLSKNDAFKTAIEAIVEVVKDNITSKSTIDLAEDAVLDQVSSAAVIAATKRGADENSMNRAVNDAVTNTKQVNKSIKLIQDVFSSEAKDVFKQVASVRETAKVAAEKIQAAEELKVSGGAISLPDITIRSVAEDGIINASEKYTSFKVSGTALSDSVVTVTFGTVTRTVTVGKSETEWEVEFNFTSSEITALKNGEYPTVLKAEGDKGGYKFEVERNVELIETPPSGSISDLGGDGVINITELQSGILVKGTSNATSGGKVTVKILKASDDSVVQNYTPIETITNSNGAWSVSLGSTNFPQENFKIQATIENQYGNTKTITSEAITVDFNAPSVSNISSSASGSIATGDVTYTITFDDTVKFFTASSLNITNGSVNNVTTVSGQNDKQYKVVITPNANSEGSITVAIPEGGAFDGSGNKNTSFSNSDQKFDTKAPSVSSVSVLETGTSNTVSTVSGTVDLKIILSEDINASNFTKSDLNVSSGTLGTVSPSSGTTNTFTVPYTPASGTDSNITLTILGGGYQDQVGNSGKSGTKVFAVDSKGPTGVLSVPTGSFSLGQKLEFSLTYDENITVPVSGEDPFLVLQIGDRVRMATKESSSDSSVLKFSYTVSNSDLDSDGIGVITTTGLSKGVFNLSGTFAAGDTIVVSNSKSGSFSVQSGATSSTAVATQLRTFLNSDSAFSSTNSLKAVGLGSGKIALVGDSADTLSLSISTGGSSTGSVAKEVSESYSASIKDSFDNNANSVFSISGDPTGITVDGGSKGVGVDGYVEGVSIFSDNDGDGQLNFGDATATTNPTGVFNMYGATGPLVMSGGTDKATGLPFGVQYEAPAGYTVINPISSIIRSIETKDSTNTGTDATAAAEQKVANSIGANVKFESFDAYNAVSTPSEIPNAIAYQKAAASVALVVDIASTGFVELVKTIEKTSTVNDPYKIENQADPFTTQKASELVFDAIADAIISGEIGSGELKSFGSSSGTVDDMTSKLLEIITPTAQNILGNNYENYKSALNNEAMVLAAGVNRIEEKPFSSDSFPTTTEDAINALTKIIQTQSVWQGDANRALEDDSTDNDWLSFNDTLTGGVTFTPVNSSGAEITKNTAGYLELNEGGYLLKVNGQPINSSTHSVKWYRVTLSENSDVISDTHTTAPTMNRVEVDGSNTVFGTDVLRVAAGGSPGDSQDALKSKGLTFEIKLNSDNSTIISKENAPVFRADTFILNENLADNIFAWGGLADGASVGVVVPTSYQISSSIDDRNKFEGGSDGEGAEYSFTVTRQGNMSQTQSIDYEVQTSQTLTAEDFDGGEIPSGTITFAPEESTKTLTIRIKNDTIKETDESFNVRLKDDIGTAQILDDVVSFAIFDDDPTNPQLSLVNTQALTVTAADGNNDTTLDFDYFDKDATFSLSSLVSGGSVAFDGKSISPSENLTFTQVKTALDKISFTGTEGNTSGSILISVSDTVRGSSGDATISYQIKNKPSITKQNVDGTTFTSGSFGSISGLSVNDIDFEDLNGDGIKNANEQTQTILTTLNTLGGKLSLVDPNDNLNNTTKVVVDIFDDERGATIQGKAGAVNTVLSSLKFSGDANQNEGRIFITASDGDLKTSDVFEEIVISGIQSAAPTISAPKSKINVKAKAVSPLPEIQVSDIDSTNLTVTITATSGVFNGIDPIIYNISGLNSSILNIVGSPAEINEGLKSLKYTGEQGAGNLQIIIDAKDETNSAIEKGYLNVNVVDNQPPEPGGDLIFKSGSDISQNAIIDEDTTSETTISFNIPTSSLVNTDGPRPTEIRIINVDGGTLKLSGVQVEAGDNATKIQLEEVKTNNVVTSYKKDFTFVPSADRTEDAVVEYAIVDPALDTANSLPSKITIPINPVNDNPNLIGDTAIRVFTEGDLGLILDSGISVKDKDSTKLSEATLILSNKQAGDTLIYSEDFWSSVENNDAKTITLTSKSSEFGKAISIFEGAIRSVKFVNSNDNPNTLETRKITINVKDKAESASNASDSANKLSTNVSFDLNVIGTNDIPQFSTAQTSIAYTEGSGASAILTNATITDGDVSSINNLFPTSAIVKISSGYKSNEDKISIPSSYSPPEGFTKSISSEGNLILNNSSGITVLTSEYDSSLGILKINNNSGSGFNMSNLKSLLETIVYTNNSDSPGLDPRKISVVISDDQNALSNEFFKTINLSAVNDNPTLDLDGTGPSQVGQDGGSSAYVGRVHKEIGVKIASNAQISDLDSDNISSMIVTLTNGVADNGSSESDSLAILQQGQNIIKANNLTITNAEVAGVSNAKITISGSASKQFYEEILQNIVFKSAETPNVASRNISIEITDVDKTGNSNKSNQKLDYTDPSNIQVVDGGKVNVSVNISDNPIALVATGTKTLALSISDNPSSETRLEVKLNEDLVTLNGSILDVPTNLGDPLYTALNVDASQVTASNIGADIFGTPQANTLTGSAQKDNISGGAGADIIDAGAEDDTVEYSSEAQSIKGGSGVDTLKIIGKNNVYIDLSETGQNANQIKILSDDNDYQNASGAIVSEFENVDASQSSGSITIIGKDGINMITKGGSNSDTIFGASGNDVIRGKQGNDTVKGGSGNDIIYGNKGSDILYGGLGTDQLRGGLGLDTYVFPNSELEDGITDVIHELQKGEKIGLSSGIKWRKINATDDTVAPTTLTDGEVESYIQKISGNYTLVIEKQADGSQKSFVNLGENRPFEPLKWTPEGQGDSIQYLTVVDNTSPELEVSKSNSLVPIDGEAAGTNTSFGTRGNTTKPYIYVDDKDNDTIFINLTSEGGTLSKNSIGSLNQKVSVNEANKELEDLLFVGSTRGDAKITVTVNDGYSSLSKEIYLSVPNTAPSISITEEKIVGKIGGIPLNMNSISLTDLDSVDQGLDASMSLVLSSTTGSFVTRVASPTDTGQTFDHDGDTDTAKITVFSTTYDNEHLFLTNENSVISVLMPKNIYSLTPSSFGGNIVSSSGHYIVEGNTEDGYVIEPVEKNTSTSNITHDFKLTTADDDIVVSNTNSALDAIDLFLRTENPLSLSGDIYDITQEIVDDNQALPLSSGKFALLGDDIDGWELQPVDITNINKIITNGNSIGLSLSEKSAFEELSLTSLGTFSSDSIPFNAGFISANLSMTGLESSLLSLSGNLDSIHGALSIIGLKGNEAGTGIITVNGSDTLGLNAQGKTLEVEFGVGDPSKPDLLSDIKSGVSIDELKNGFAVSINIAGTGVKVGDNVSLFSSYNNGNFDLMEEISLSPTDISNGFIDFQIDPLSFPSIQSLASASGGVSNLSLTQLSVLEGSYIFKARINNNTESLNSDQINLDFTGPTSPDISFVNTNESTTDTGILDNDNITNVQRPSIILESESNLNLSDISLDISDGAGVSKFNQGSFANVFSIGTEEEIQINGVATGNSKYPINFSSIDLPDNDYGFYMIDSSGNKSPEALKIKIDTVDEYGHVTQNIENFGGYLFSIPKGYQADFYGGPLETENIFQNIFSSNNTLFNDFIGDSVQLNGSEHFLVDKQKLITLRDEGYGKLSLKIMDNLNQVIFDVGEVTTIPTTYSELFSYKSKGWFTIDTNKPYHAVGDLISLSNSHKNAFDQLNISAESYTYHQSSDHDPSPVYVVTPEKAIEFGSEISNSNLIESGGTFALLGNENNGFSLQKITPGELVLTEFEDKGRSSTDNFSNDSTFVLNIENREPFTSVVFKKKIDNGSFETTSKNQDLNITGTQDLTYKAIITDLAGNSVETEELVLKLEKDVPVFSGPIDLGSDDVGLSNSDRITSVQQPTFTFTSEPNLRIFMQEVGSNRELQELSANYTSTTETSGQYSVSISENLSSGTYQIIIEDDAGNASAPHPDFSFKIDSEPPSISSIQLIDNTDKGISSDDLSTAVTRPVVIFEGESDLNLTIKHDNGSTVSVMPSSSYTVSGGNDENLRLFEIFSENTSGEKTISIIAFDIFGNEKSIPELDAKNIVYKFQYSSDGISYTDASPNDYNDEKLSINLNSEEDTPELEGVSHIKTQLVDFSNNILVEKISLTTQSEIYGLRINLDQSRQSFNPEVYTISENNKIPVEQLSSISHNLKTLISSDGGNSFKEPELDFDIKGITHLKFALEDLSGQNARIVTEQTVSVSDFFSKIPGGYTINFNSDLTDGNYTISVMDNAGNFVEGSVNQTFNIDTTVPSFLSPIDLGATDLGRFKQNILYTQQDQDDGLIPNGKEVGDIKIATDRLTNVTRPEISFKAEQGLRTFISYDDLNGNISLLPDPFASLDDQGYQEPVYDIPTYNSEDSRYSIVFKDGFNLSDGLYTIIIEDDAGNRVVGGNDQKLTIETIKPDLSEVSLINDTDSGKSTVDRLTNFARPEIQVTSEIGLRIFVEKELSNENNILLPKQGVDNDPVYSVVGPDPETEGTGQYSILFSSDLDDGLYAIFGEDDAGNISETNFGHKFIIDRTLPDLPKINLGTSDTGKSDTDLFTKDVRPTVEFSTEPGLQVFVVNISENQILNEKTGEDTGDFTVITTNNNYQILFENELSDGSYLVKVRDDAGNINLQGEGLDVFRIDSTIPTFNNAISLGDTDKGRDSTDRATNIKKPEVTFKSEEGLTVEVLYSGFNSTITNKLPLSHYNFFSSKNLSLTVEQKDLLITLPQVTSYDRYPIQNVVTISSQHLIDQPNLNLDEGSYALSGSDTEGWEVTKVNIDNVNNIFSLGMNSELSSTQKEALDTLSLTSVGNFDPYKPMSVYTISNDHLISEPGLGLSAGSYALKGNSLTGWIVEPINIDNAPSYLSVGTEIPISAEQKVLWDGLNLTPLNDPYDPYPLLNVYTVSKTAVTENPDLGLIEGSYALTGNDTDGWNVEIINDIIFKVTTAGGKYFINGVEKDDIQLTEGNIYVFDWSEASSHPLKFSDTADGEHAGGLEYTEGVVIDNVNSKTIITVNHGAPDLFYYCGSHPAMGSSVSTLSNLNNRLVDYKLTFNSDLQDGQYTLLIRDDAGNEAIGGTEQSFSINTELPNVTPILLNEGLDTGISDSDRSTTVRLPNFQFQSEEGLRVFIEREMDASYTGPLSNGLLIEDIDYTVQRDGVLYGVDFLTEFPDETQGTYRLIVEDDFGNQNEIVSGSTDHLIRVDNLAPLLVSQRIDETGRILELKFNEELDLDPGTSDVTISLVSSNGSTNQLSLRDAEIINTADNKSVAKYFLDFPIFSGDNFEISFIGSNLSKFKDLVGKFFVDPGSIVVTNESQIVRSSGIVADGYLSGSRVFHDLNENGIFDDNSEVFVTSFDDGSFKGLHGDVAKPLVAVGGIDTSTGLSFKYKNSSGTENDITLYSSSNATVINPLTSLVFKIIQLSKPQDIYSLDFDLANNAFILKKNEITVNIDDQDIKLIFTNNGTVAGEFTVENAILTERDFNDKVIELFSDDVDAFNEVVLVILEKGTNVEISRTNTFQSIEDAKTSTPVSNYLTPEEATLTLINNFSKITSLNDVFNYDPVANNNVNVQAVSSQIANLMTSIPFLLNEVTDSNQVLDILVNYLMSRNNEDPQIDLGSQSDLEAIFNVDNTPPSQNEAPLNLLRELALANKSIGDSLTIEGQFFGIIAARDDILANRVSRDLNNIEFEFQSTVESEKFIGSNDDDIIFGNNGNDLFGGGSDSTSINEGDIFVGGEGKDTAVINGQESDYIFMVENPGSTIYEAIETSLNNGNLNNQKLLILQKATDPTSYIYIQTEVIRFTNDGSWISFNQINGEISGNMIDEILVGSKLKTDLFNGGSGDDILQGSGGQQNEFDILKGGFGNDKFIIDGSNTEVTGGYGQDVFEILSLDGSLLIKDLSSSDDKIDLRAFKKSGSSLTITDIEDASSIYNGETTTGVKIDLSGWTKETETYGGSIIIEGASLDNDGHIKLADMTLLTNTNFFIETLENNDGGG